MRRCGKNRYATLTDAQAAYARHPRRKPEPYVIVEHARCGGWHIVPESEAHRFTAAAWTPDPPVEAGRCAACDNVSDGCHLHRRDPSTVVWDMAQRRYVPV